MVNAIESGYVQQAILQDAYRQQQRFESGEDVRVGVNKFVAEKQENHAMRPYMVNPADGEAQARVLAELRKTRNNEAVRRSLDALRKVAATSENVMPAITEAVSAYATMGEICGAMKDVFGEYRSPAAF